MTTTMAATKKLVNVANIYGPNYMSKMKSLVNIASAEEVETLKTSVMDMIIYYNDLIHPDEVISNAARWSNVILSFNNDSAINYIDSTFMKYYGYHFWDIHNIVWSKRPGARHGSASIYVETTKMFWDLGLVHQLLTCTHGCTDIKHAIDETEINRVFESLR